VRFVRAIHDLRRKPASVVEWPVMSTPLSRALARPLILGASVSADFATLSPGKRLALRHTSAENILTRAKGGRTGIETLASLTSAEFEGRTSILAVDLFFWDSGLPEARASINGLREVAARAKSLSAPLLLGDIPELLPGWQPSRAKLNEAVAQLSGTVRVVPFDRMFQELRATGGLQIAGRRRSWRELAPDGLHIGAEAAEILSGTLETLLAEIA
jgi:hypothetical protein